jgi:hypothetical protein
MGTVEYNQIINETYENYIRVKKDYHERLINNLVLDVQPLELLSIDEFICKIKVDSDFSDRWLLKIKELELSTAERMEYYDKHYMKENETKSYDELLKVDYDGLNIPIKLITIKYKDKTIESYE